jgi:LPXTG-motif cell wall-anchored protein
MVFSKRNAFIGWLVITLGKPIAKRKAKAAVTGSSGKKGGAALAALAAAGAGLMFWRKRRSNETPPD